MGVESFFLAAGYVIESMRLSEHVDANPEENE